MDFELEHHDWFRVYNQKSQMIFRDCICQYNYLLPVVCLFLQDLEKSLVHFLVGTCHSQVALDAGAVGSLLEFRLSLALGLDVHLVTIKFFQNFPQSSGPMVSVPLQEIYFVLRNGTDHDGTQTLAFEIAFLQKFFHLFSTERSRNPCQWAQSFLDKLGADIGRHGDCDGGLVFLVLRKAGVDNADHLDNRSNDFGSFLGELLGVNHNFELCCFVMDTGIVRKKSANYEIVVCFLEMERNPPICEIFATSFVAEAALHDSKKSRSKTNVLDQFDSFELISERHVTIFYGVPNFR